jgi:3-dehydroquinate dehydratase I
MSKPKICAVITRNDPALIARAGAEADLYEVRIDLIGHDWLDLVKILNKPWLATNRLKTEGGAWEGNEEARRDELLKAARFGASIVDVELATPDLDEIVPAIKRNSRCLISHHDNHGTPPLSALHRIIEGELAAGADICKLVVTAGTFEDNVNLLNLLFEFRSREIVAFAQGPHSQMSRLLCPLDGAPFTYAAPSEDTASAPGQLTVSQMRQIYGMMDL